MAQVTIVTTMGEEEFHLKGLTLKELLAVKSWSGGSFGSKDEFVRATNVGDPEALLAAYAIAVWRRTGSKPRLDDLDFDTDTMESRLVDETGRTVELVFETTKDGSLKLKDGEAILSRDVNGQPQLRYTDTQELVPPTETPSPTN